MRAETDIQASKRPANEAYVRLGGRDQAEEMRLELRRRHIEQDP
jgi:hypothetical protein